MGDMLHVLHSAYDHPVDTEFTANFTDLQHYKINLLQCRPFQAKGNILGVSEPFAVPAERTVMSSAGPVIGSNVATHHRPHHLRCAGSVRADEAGRSI